jgi:hypothetical protein
MFGEIFFTKVELIVMKLCLWGYSMLGAIVSSKKSRLKWFSLTLQA